MLIDLDDLVATCPDPRSRQYIRESVQCYKTGAYRSSIVACWIAVAFDLIDKIREIAASGDKAAQEQIARFDKIRNSGDIAGALAFEKELPSLARDRFEFISHIECQDLMRLVEDRNRCAHPSQVSDTEIFEASPELARLHIVNVIRCVLSQPPAQGKAALERMVAELKSKFFPSKFDDVFLFLEAGPLRRPKISLVKNYMQILLKILLGVIVEPYEIKKRAKDALLAVRKIRPEMWEPNISPLLIQLISQLATDDEFKSAVSLLDDKNTRLLWDYIDAPQQLRLVTFVENFPADSITDLESVLDTPDHPLHRAAVTKIKTLPSKEIRGASWFTVPDVVLAYLIRVYGYSRSFAEANDFGKYLREQARWTSMPLEHLSQIIRVGVENDQVRGSNQFELLVDAYGNAGKLPRDAIIALVRDVGLSTAYWDVDGLLGEPVDE